MPRPLGDAAGELLELPDYYADFQRNFRRAREFWKLEAPGQPRLVARVEDLRRSRHQPPEPAPGVSDFVIGAEPAAVAGLPIR
jgi:hypothetical protein